LENKERTTTATGKKENNKTQENKQIIKLHSMGAQIKKVFIVDDDEMFSTMLLNHLSKDKMLDVMHFSTGEECLNEMSQGPDVVILDYNLDTVEKEAENGVEILAKIKKISPNIHAIMLSSQTNYGVAAFSISKGAEQYVMKDETAFENIHSIIKSIIRNER
jgi:DNA-binding NarL/FixJ family response regulator